MLTAMLAYDVVSHRVAFDSACVAHHSRDGAGCNSMMITKEYHEKVFDNLSRWKDLPPAERMHSAGWLYAVQTVGDRAVLCKRSKNPDICLRVRHYGFHSFLLSFPFRPNGQRATVPDTVTRPAVCTTHRHITTAGAQRKHVR